MRGSGENSLTSAEQGQRDMNSTKRVYSFASWKRKQQRTLNKAARIGGTLHPAPSFLLIDLGPCRRKSTRWRSSNFTTYYIDGEIHQPILQALAPEFLRRGLDPSSDPVGLGCAVAGDAGMVWNTLFPYGLSLKKVGGRIQNIS